MSEPTGKPLTSTRALAPGQQAEVWIVDLDRGVPELVFTSDELLLEAPNWAPDGTGLLLNGDGLLWRLDLEPAVVLGSGRHRGSAADQQRPRHRRPPWTDLPVGQRRPPLCRTYQRRRRHQGQPRSESPPLPTRGQPRRSDLGLRRTASRQLLSCRSTRAHPRRRRSHQLPRGGQQAHRRTGVLPRRGMDLPEHRGVRIPAWSRAACPSAGNRGERWTGSSTPIASTGSRTSLPTVGMPPTSASRPEHWVIPPISRWRSVWSTSATGRARCTPSLSSGARARST